MSLRRLILAALTPRNRARLFKMLAPLVMIPAGTAGASGQTQTLNVVLAPAASITTPSGVTLTSGGTTFGNFISPSVNIQFWVRNSQPSGAGNITVKAAEFSPANGVSGPMIASGNVTYVCSAASVGAACSGTQTLSTTTSTPVVTLPASVCTGTGCTGTNPQTVQVLFTLANNTKYKTGSYSALLTFTISAT